MVGHQTKGVDAVPKSFDPFLDEEAEARAIFVLKEDRLPRVTTKDDVIEYPWKVHPGFPGHRPRLHHQLLH